MSPYDDDDDTNDDNETDWPRVFVAGDGAIYVVRRTGALAVDWDSALRVSHDEVQRHCTAVPLPRGAEIDAAGVLRGGALGLVSRSFGVVACVHRELAMRADSRQLPKSVESTPLTSQFAREQQEQEYHQQQLQQQQQQELQQQELQQQQQAQVQQQQQQQQQQYYQQQDQSPVDALISAIERGDRSSLARIQQNSGREFGQLCIEASRMILNARPVSYCSRLQIPLGSNIVVCFLFFVFFF